MRRPFHPRKTASLSESAHKRLDMYAIAATAAGVGALALTQSAEAKIIYTQAHKVIGRNHSVVLDLNHDGKADFTFHETFITTTSVGENHSLILSVLPGHKNNGIVGMDRHASALSAGVRLGPKRRFSYGKKLMAVDYYADGTGGSGTCAGPWNNVKNRYLGFKFSIKGKAHFGWARLNVSCTTTFGTHTVTGVLTGYAYETTPNKAIVTGQTKRSEDESGIDQANSASLTTPVFRPASLGQLAMGAPGLFAWRREDSAERDGELSGS
jgi:hypothetical protein